MSRESVIHGSVIGRLGADAAPAIVACFRRVYDDSYANELFYDVQALEEAIRAGQLVSVGAVADDGAVLAHMALTRRPGASVAELGNTVVDPVARGGGLAWRVGAELSRLTQALGYSGFIHYPTTDHHIMQRHSVERGFETGLMLGYIPPETDGQVSKGSVRKRQAATIVYEPYEPYGPGPAASNFLPERFADLLLELAAPTGLTRTWLGAPGGPAGTTGLMKTRLVRRALLRWQIRLTGCDFDEALQTMGDSGMPCEQLDLRLEDPAIDRAVESAADAGFRFCGWLPGFFHGDVLRMQRVDESVTDLDPALENPVARRLLADYRNGR